MGQAALGIVCRDGDARAMELLRPLDHRVTHLCCAAERALLRQLEGGCKVPIAASTVWDDSASTLTLRGVVISLDGQRFVDHTATAAVSDRADAVALGQAVVRVAHVSIATWSRA